MSAQPDLFGGVPAPAARTGMDAEHDRVARPRLHRTPDAATSVRAAEAMLPKLTDKQRVVLTAFAAHGTLTGKQLERLPGLATWAPSTARKRITELASAAGGFRLCRTGETRDGCDVYRETTPYERARLREGLPL